MLRATFACPLCRKVGRVVTLEAELEPAPPLLIVTDLQGRCTHAAAFGALEGDTLEEAWGLIEAALDAAGGYDVRPIDAPQSPEPICQQPRGTSWSAARSPGSRRQQPASHGS